MVDPDDVMATLKRKLGPLPIWVWAIIAGVILYYLRAKGYFGGGTTSADALQPSQTPAKDAGPPVVLQPGEGAYDPNTGVLTTNPGGGGGTSSGGGGAGAAGDPSVTQDPGATSPSQTGGADGTVPPAAAVTPHTSTTRKSPLARAKSAVLTGKVGPKNTRRLRNAGYSQSEIAYHEKHKTALPSVPITHKRTSKVKPAHNQTSSGKGSKGSVKPRGSAALHTASVGRSAAKSVSKAIGHVTPRAVASAGKSSARQRPTAGAVRQTTPVHHPVSAGHATAAAKAATPAAPARNVPPRVIRTPPPPPPPKKPAKPAKRR